MARTTTTLSSAVAINDPAIVVASATGFAVGNLIKIDQEIMKVAQAYPGSGTTIQVLRGRDGTAGAVHRAGASVITFLPSDQPSPLSPQTTVMLQTQKADVLTSYTASGAITLPQPGSDATAVLNGTAALAMTVAAPTADMDGCRLRIVGNGKAAHTVTVAGGLGLVGATADVLTFSATQQMAVDLVAAGVSWQPSAVVAGAATIAGAGIA